MQVEYVRKRIGILPALGQAWLNIEMLITSEKIIEQQVIDALGIGIQSYAGIQIRGTVLDDHDQRVWGDPVRT
jgi:hypothetical protein